jgi:D-amino peptidase
MMQGLDGSFGAVLFVSYHGSVGAPAGLSHTYNPRAVVEARLGGVVTGEAGINALVAAHHGVPVVLVTGDDRTCEDAKGYAPRARCVAVKDYVSRYAAVCRTPGRTAADISSAARMAARLAVRSGPSQPQEHTVELEFDAEHLVGAATAVPGVERTGERRVAYTSPGMYEGIRTFKAVTTVVSAAVEEQYG